MSWYFCQKRSEKWLIVKCKALLTLILELVKSFGPEFCMKRGTGQTSTRIPSSFAIRPQQFCLVFGKIHIAKYESTFIELRINDNDNLEKNCGIATLCISSLASFENCDWVWFTIGFLRRDHYHRLAVFRSPNQNLAVVCRWSDHCRFLNKRFI